MGVQPLNAQSPKPNGAQNKAEHHRTYHKRKTEFASTLASAQATPSTQQNIISVQSQQSKTSTPQTSVQENGAAKNPSLFAPPGYRDGVILTSMKDSGQASKAASNSQPTPSEPDHQSDIQREKNHGSAAQNSILEESQPLVEPKAQIDPSQTPQAVTTPLTDTQLATTDKIGLIGNRSLQAGEQYGPVFSSAEAATEYARLGMSRDWFDGPSFFSFNTSQGAAIVRTQGGYAVYGTELPWGFSTQDRMQYHASPTASDVASKLEAVTPTPSLVALVNHE